MKDYLVINQKSYNLVAEELYSKSKSYSRIMLTILGPFINGLKQDFKGKQIRVLDVGCGAGLNLSLMSKSGFDAVGIDFAENAIRFAKLLDPNAELINAELLGWKTERKFQGLIANAFLPLFPCSKIPEVLAKFNQLLVSGGHGFVGFSVVEKNGLVVKHDFKIKVHRYRNGLAIDSIASELSNYFKILEISTSSEIDDSGKRKVWYNIHFQK